MPSFIPYRFCVLGVLALAPPIAQAGLCHTPYPNVTIRAVMAPITYDYTQSKTAFAPGVAGDLSGNIRVQSIPKSSVNNGCIVLEGLEMVIENTSRMRVTTAYPQGSCEFNVVHAHEQQHAMVIKTFFLSLEQFKPLIVNPLMGNTGVPVQQQPVLSALLNQVAVDLQSAVMRQHATLQYEQVDHPELMKAALAKCSQW